MNHAITPVPWPPGSIPHSMFLLQPLVVLQASSQNLSGRARCPGASVPGLRAPQPSEHHTHLLPPAPAHDGGCVLLREGVFPPQKGFPWVYLQTQELLPRNLLASQAFSFVCCLCLCHPLTLRGAPYLPNCRHKQCPEHSGWIRDNLLNKWISV